MRRVLINFFLPVLVLAAPVAYAAAQVPISPWFKGSEQAWRSLFARRAPLAVTRATSCTALSGLSTGYAVKTTAANWVNYRLKHSSVFSDVEKKLLAEFPSYEKALLGKLSFFHDREAWAFNLMEGSPLPAYADEQVFERHQTLLKNTLAEMEAFYARVLPERYESRFFSRTEIARLLADPGQPPAFTLREEEILRFNRLSSLEEQRAFVQNLLNHSRSDLNGLLAKNPADIKPFEFDRYYLQKLRLSYFTTVLEVLQNATQKRASLIVRRKRNLNVDLPGAKLFMTDAERLGFLHFHLDQELAPKPGIPADPYFVSQTVIELRAVLSAQQRAYEIYAEAEAFGAPYEQLLSRGMARPDIVLTPARADEVQAMSSTERSERLPRFIQEVRLKKAALLQQTPDSPAFYVRYYRLQREEVLYSTILTRERVFREFNK